MYLTDYNCEFNNIEALWSTVKIQLKSVSRDVTLKIDDAVTDIKNIMDKVPIYTLLAL